ncbi:MAG TPA: Yip1 family protein [Syntrophomonadaceae bacterium]|nr:Yip1 family protein [Syntrophomonadaceae bacterium]
MEEKNMSMTERFWKVLASPGEAFSAIIEDPKILWPGIIIIAITLFMTVIAIPETKTYTEQLMAAQGNSPDQIALAMKFVVPGAVIGTIFAMPLLWLVQAGLLALYNQISVGEARFKQLFAVAIFSGIPSIIKAVISTCLIKTMGMKAAMQVSTSLALFMGTPEQPSFLYRLLGQIELFSIWGLVLLIVGGAMAMKRKPGGLAVFMGVIWILYVAVMALLVKTPAI